MNYKTITCLHCGTEKNIYIGEYNRKIKKQTPFFCSRSCCGSFNIKRRNDLKKYNHSEENRIRLAYLNKIKSESVDVFLYFLKNCKIRKTKELNITTNYLRTVWDSQKGLCAVSNIPLELPTNTRGFKTIKPFNGASLDRINSSLGYIEGNVQFVCIGINFMKNDWDSDYFNNWLLQVSKSILDKYNDSI
ncbi:MAG: hypothetical protein IM613_12530 [Cytophagales bacterium]|nr:hypothetical protein [Cytophagales bacterium]